MDIIVYRLACRYVQTNLNKSSVLNEEMLD